MKPKEALFEEETQNEELIEEPLFGEQIGNKGGFDAVVESSSIIGEEEGSDILGNGPQPIPYERLMMYVGRVLEDSPETVQEVQQRISNSGLSPKDIEDLDILAKVSFANPELYPSMVETIKAKFPETRESLTGELMEDDDILIDWVMANFVAKGGM